MVFWGLILTLATEGILDIATGCFLSLNKLSFSTWSDYFDVYFTLIIAMVVVSQPFILYWFMKQNIDTMHLKVFKNKFGPLVEGYKVGSDE